MLSESWTGMDKHPIMQAANDSHETAFAEKPSSITEHIAPEDDEVSLASSIDDTLSNASKGDLSVPRLPPAPTGELTLAAILSPGVPWKRRMLLLTAVVAINIGLPFINGVMLGFGEIFARAFIAPWIGLAPPVPFNRFSVSPADVPALPIRPWTGIRSWFSRSPSQPSPKPPHA